MHETLPFDEATTPPRVSTGDLPMHAEIRQVVTDAYERYRGEEQRQRRGLHPRAGGGVAGPVRIAVVDPAAGRSRSGMWRRFSIQSVSKPFVFALVCEAVGSEEARLRLGVNGTGLPFNSLMAVELNAERTMNPMVNAGAIATTSLVPGATAEEKWAAIRERLSRFAGRELASRRGLRLGVGHQHAQPGHRPPPRELRAALLRPRRGDRRLHPSVLPGRDRPRPRGDGGHAGQRRREPGHRRDGDQTRGVPASAGRDVERRVVRAVGDWLYQVGVPGKSGVSGGIVTVAPGKGGLATYSPPLDAAGNSIRGQLATKYLAERLGLNLFASVPAEGSPRQC